jgi:nicotinamide mononucleotide transporter
MNKLFQNCIVPTIFILLSVIFGIISNDTIIGIPTLATGLLCAWFASKGKKINYILGFINYLLMAYISFINHLYGLFIFNTFIFAPLQINGFLTWNKHSDEENNVIVKKFTIKNSFVILSLCIVGSIFLGYLLTLIPTQRLSFLDASSNCINLCGIILMILRFRESWWLWLVNNIVDLVIWVITFIVNGPNSTMMLLVSISYLLLNVYGIVNWNIKLNKKVQN